MKLSSLALAGALSLGLAGAAHADFPTYYADQTAFTAAGTIQHVVDFDGYDPNAITVLNNTETFGPMSLTGSPLVVVGSDSVYQPVRNLIANNNPTLALTGDVSGAYNMFSFQLGNLEGFGEQVFMWLYTNVDSYAYGLYPGPAPENLTFYGFVVPLGEYFTGFSMHATNLDGFFQDTPIDQALAVTDFRFGTTGPICSNRICDGGDPGGAIPEPGTWALLILGFGCTGAALRARRRPLTRAARI